MTRGSQRITALATGLCLLAAAVVGQVRLDDKWSRQLEATGAGQGDSFDWVPLAQPVDGSGSSLGSSLGSGAAKDRSANGRVLTYSQTFPPNARFGDLPKAQSVPQQQQTFDFPYQFQRFSPAPQAQPLRQQPQQQQPLKSQEPTSQSFFKFEMPFHGDGGRVASGGAGLQTGYQIQHTFGGGGAQATLFQSPLYSPNPVFPPEFHPQLPKPQSQSLQQQQKPLHQQNFIEDSYPLKGSVYRDAKPQQQTAQETLQTVTPQVFPLNPGPEPLFELNKPSSFQLQSSPFHASAPTAAPSGPAQSNNQQQQQQDVQLLYVPYDTLFNQQQQRPQSSQAGGAFEVNKYNVNPGLPAVNPYQINQFYTQDPLGEPNFFSSSTTTHRPTLATTLPPTTPKPLLFQNFVNPPQLSYSPAAPTATATATATRPPKPKAHQPPLAMFLVRSSARPTQSDVVAALRNAHTIAVLDAPTKQTPEIFVGPAGMPIPTGYVKFDLPYLSQLAQTRDLRDVPFFVAPLSYRTPNGFNKILLPEPHVGSIVVNRAKDHGRFEQGPAAVAPAPPQQQNTFYVTPDQSDFTQYQSSTPRPRPSGPQRVKSQPPSQSQSQSQLPKDLYFQDVQKTRNPFEVTTSRPRGNKFNYFYDQDAIQEVTSPKITKHDRPQKKKRPQSVTIEQAGFGGGANANAYAQFRPIPNQIAADDYYKIPAGRPAATSTTSTAPAPTSTSTSTTTTTTTSTTTSTTPAPTFYTFPQVEFQSTNGQLYHDFTTAPQAAPEEPAPRFTTRPPPQPTTAEEEEYRMKQYFRQQEAFRHRPQLVHTTNAPPSAPAFEQVHYTPVSLDYDRETTTPRTRTTTAHRQRVTIYSPTPAPPAYDTTVPPAEEPLTTPPHPANHRPSYSQTQHHHQHQQQQNEILEGNVEYEPNPYQLPSELPPLTPNLPGLVNGLQEKDKQQPIATHHEQTSAVAPSSEPPTRPTRRPLNRVRKPVVKVTSSVSYSESEAPSRRPSHRIRRPYGSRGSSTTSSSSSSSTSGSGSSSGYAATNGADESRPSSTTRRPSTAARNPLIRNPNRVRYQPTPEERQTLRLKQRKKYGGSTRVAESEDLDYQRDVLKQNYPVFRPGTGTAAGAATTARRPTSPTAIPSAYNTQGGVAVTTTDRPTSESQQVYTVTPSNAIDTGNYNTYNYENDNRPQSSFPAGLLEPMQIAQQYNEYKDNYGPGYFPNQEDLNPTEPAVRNEINPVYTATSVATTTPPTTTTTTAPETTEEPATAATTTRRSPFIRRNYPRLRTTTTEQPSTTPGTPTEERPSIRARIPPRKVIKVRARTRRPPLLATSTSAPQAEAAEEEPQQQQRQEPKNNYRKLNRFNQDLFESQDSPRRRYKPQFQLDGQESQWSPALKTGSATGSGTGTVSRNSFKPLHPKEQRKQEQEETKLNYADEPEIVTAAAEHDAANEPKKAETYEFNVSANFGSSGADSRTGLRRPNLKPEKSFAELLEEVMGKAPEEQPTTPESEAATTSMPRTTDGTFFESQKTAISNRLNRRGKWKKLRVSSGSRASASGSAAASTNGNGESFETAESQSLGSQLYNSLYNTVEKQEKAKDELVSELRTTTPLTPTTASMTSTMQTTASEFTTTPLPVTMVVTTTAPPSTADDYDLTTARLWDSTTQQTTVDEEEKYRQMVMTTTTSMPDQEQEDSATRRHDADTGDMDMDMDMGGEDDLESQPSLFSEVKRQLHELFAIEENDDQAVSAALAAGGRRRQEYTNIQRPKPTEVPTTTEATNGADAAVTEATDEKNPLAHKNLMEHVVYATATSTKVSSETEICYRGRCIRSEDLPPNHKLN